jgi:hypothetical protein
MTCTLIAAVIVCTGMTKPATPADAVAILLRSVPPTVIAPRPTGPSVVYASSGEEATIGPWVFPAQLPDRWLDGTLKIFPQGYYSDHGHGHSTPAPVSRAPRPTPQSR